MARWVYPRNGPRVLVSPGHPLTRIADNDSMKSMAMGCATLSGQKKRIEFFAKKGIDVKFHPRTGQMLYPGGYQTQKKLAKHSGLEID